ncbi:MAG: isopentenyldiphosphate isomerase [Candidatus Poriferisodalaceae bacterium]|jgi:isopentenyldiphosphate isomerase
MTNSASHVEHLDIFDDVGRHIGVKSRRDVHLDGDWHHVFHCQIVADRDGIATTVLQGRSMTKAAFPGLLDISAAGHLAAGETPEDGLRELEEELGVRAEAAHLTSLGVRRLVDDSGEGTLNRELTHVFLLRDDRPIEDYVVDPGEVSGVWEVAISDLLALLGGSIDSVTIDGVLEAGANTARSAQRDLTLADLVPSDGYWVTLMVMAQRFHAGDTPLAI